MKCPFCGEINNKVVDSRLGREKNAIRRRRECMGCTRRFTTYERIEEVPIMIIKKDGRRELFNRKKLRSGINRACEKRNISMHMIEAFIDELERDLRETGEKEIPAAIVGEKTMARLHQLDDVAYVRFASVYREFKDVNDFVSELKLLLNNRKNSGQNGNTK
jgi:transcriptional repressor NrdR